ncbi:hypothetical protein ACT4S2_02745 [Kocuria turfanensis]|uniref:hypothetical protein n=1 Tax=Kocuria turfanensis TaxID=388357 RepID=UPI004036A959
MTVTSEQLLAGPRGRRLCWELAVPADQDTPGWAWQLQERPTPARIRAASQELARVDAPALAADARAVLRALVQAVDAALYWQPPDEIDQALADPELRDALVPIAQAVSASPALDWWSRPVARLQQRWVQFTGMSRDGPPLWRGAAGELARWRAAALDMEDRCRAAMSSRQPPDSGEWWSTPSVSALLSTTGPAPGLEALGLVAVEDSVGPEPAHIWPVAVDSRARVYEISGPEDWVRLVSAYPLELTASKGLDWPTITGVTGRWFLPDWPAVAADHDGVHLSVAGYLATNGRALPVAGGHTVLAGWDPDATWWLTDVLHYHGEPRLWVPDAEDVLAWTARN